MASIGEAALILSTQAAGLYSGLDKAGAHIRSWGSGIGSKLTGGMGSIATGVGAMVIAGVGSAIAGLHFLEARVKNLAAIGRQAATIGVASDVFMAMGQQAQKLGIDTGTLSTALIKLNAHMGGAGKGSAEFNAALGKMGLTAEGKTADVLFTDMAEAIAKLPTKSAQATAAMQAFGKQGKDLLPMLQQGKKGIESFIEAQRAKGLLISPEDMKRIQEVRAVIPNTQALFEAFWNKITIAALPLIKTINEKLQVALSKMGPALDIVGQLADGAFTLIIDLLETVGGWIRDGVVAFNELTGGIGESTSAAVNWGDVLIASTSYVRQGLSYVWDGFKAGGGVIMYVSGWIIKMFSHMADGILFTLKLLDKVTPGTIFKGAIESIQDSMGEIDKWGTAVKDVGADMVTSFGDNAKAIAKGTDEMLAKRMADRLKPKELLPKELGAEAANVGYHPTGAALKDSAESLKIQAAFQGDALLNQSKDKHLDEQKKTNTTLGSLLATSNKMLDALSNKPTEMAVV